MSALPAGVLAAAQEALAAEPEEHRVLVLARLRRHWPDLLVGLREAYGDAGEEAAAAAAATAVRGAVERPADLRLLDLQRLVEPDWFQAPRMLGYACYADRFAGDLRGVADRAPYLAELGVTYLHLLPLLREFVQQDWGWYMTLALAAQRHAPMDTSFVTCPVTLVAGRHDVLTSVHDVVEAAERVPGAEVVVLPGSHFLPLEHPDQVHAALDALAARAQVTA